MDVKKIKIVANTLFFLYFIPYLLYVVTQLFFLNYVFLFQTGLLILYSLTTGMLLHISYGNNTPSTMNKKDYLFELVHMVFQLKCNILSVTTISMIFTAICLYNMSNIIIFGCPTINSPDGIKEIELLNGDIDRLYSLDEIEDIHIDHSLKRSTLLFYNKNVNDFYLTILCFDEQVLFYIVLFFSIYLMLLNFVTIYSYCFSINAWDYNKSTRYHHFVFTSLHFIPVLIILMAQIVFVYRVSMIYNGLYVPFGFLTGLLIAIMRTQSSNIYYDNNGGVRNQFEITSPNRFYICISSIFSIIYLFIYIAKLMYSFSQCTSNIPYPTESTNKMYTDFLVTELCSNEYIPSILLISFVSYILVLSLVTLLLYLFYFRDEIK